MNGDKFCYIVLAWSENIPEVRFLYFNKRRRVMGGTTPFCRWQFHDDFRKCCKEVLKSAPFRFATVCNHRALWTFNFFEGYVVHFLLFCCFLGETLEVNESARFRRY